MISHYGLCILDYLFDMDKFMSLAFFSNELQKYRSYAYFKHPNSASSVVLWFVIEYIYICKNKKNGFIIGTILIIISYYSYYNI